MADETPIADKKLMKRRAESLEEDDATTLGVR